MTERRSDRCIWWGALLDAERRTLGRDPYLLETSVPGILGYGVVRFVPGAARRRRRRRGQHGHCRSSISSSSSRTHCRPLRPTESPSKPERSIGWDLGALARDPGRGRGARNGPQMDSPDGIVAVAVSEPTDSLETCVVWRVDDTSPVVEPSWRSRPKGADSDRFRLARYAVRVVPQRHASYRAGVERNRRHR